MKNAVHSNTMGDVQKHMDFELIEEPKRYEKEVNSPAFKNNIVNEQPCRGYTDKAKSKIK